MIRNPGTTRGGDGRMSRVWESVVLAAVIAGLAAQLACASASGTPFRELGAPEGKATLYVYNDGGPGKIEIALDGNPLGILQRGGYFAETVTPGIHEVLCVPHALLVFTCISRSFRAETNQSYFFRLGKMKRGSAIGLSRIDEPILNPVPGNEALGDLETLRASARYPAAEDR